MGQFQFTKTGIEGLVVVEPKVFGDNRGYFMENHLCWYLCGTGTVPCIYR